MRKLLAVLPCYNEEKNIEELMEAWLNEGDKLTDMGYKLFILAVDDKSRDNTKNIIQKLAASHEDVRLCAHEVNQGLGGAVTTGFKYFLENFSAGDICFVMDGDNTHDPKFAVSMVEKVLKGFDCVIASRYCSSSDVVGVPGYRNFLSSGARFYYKLLLPVPSVQDYTCGYRAYTYEILDKAYRKYGDRFVTQKTFACMMEILYKLHKAGAAFAEVPFVLRYDFKQGESKMRVMKTVKSSVLTALKLRLGSI
jgi:dolichol-phosphate mannosyltransferase